MELTVFLSKVLGLYMLIVGVGVLMHPRHLVLGVGALVEEKFARIVVGIVALLFGLFLVNLHNVWTTLPAIIVTIIGWASFVKGIMYLFLTQAQIDKVVKMFNHRKWYLVDGVIAIIIGVYLAGFGYGWF